MSLIWLFDVTFFCVYGSLCKNVLSLSSQLPVSGCKYLTVRLRREKCAVVVVLSVKSFETG